MKICPNCNNQLEDNAAFCNNCGFAFNASQQNQASAAADPFDHTAEFDPKDISDNKVISMLVYLLGAIGIIIALLAANNSPYAAFHVRQALKFTVVEILVGICTALLCWTCIVPVISAILCVVLLVLKIVCFFQICKGQAKEPALIRDLKFLK